MRHFTLLLVKASAGILEELKDLVERNPQPNVIDLTPESVNMLSNLMLAQAQECFVEKVGKRNDINSIVHFSLRPSKIT